MQTENQTEGEVAQPRQFDTPKIPSERAEERGEKKSIEEKKVTLTMEER